MKRTANSLKWLILVLILALALSACERPVPGSNDSGQNDNSTPAETPVLTIPTTPPEEVQPEPYPAPGDAGTGETPTEVPATGEDATDTGNEPAAGGDETTPPEETAEPTATPEAATGNDGTTDTTTPTGERIHIVQTGENLFRIGLQYGFTYQELAAYNGIANPNAIEVGQEIRIPPSDQ